MKVFLYSKKSSFISLDCLFFFRLRKISAMEISEVNLSVLNGELTISKGDIPQVEKDFIQNVHTFMRLREQIILKSQCSKNNFSKKSSKFISYDTVKVKDKELRNLIKICKKNLDRENSGESSGIDYYATSLNVSEENRTMSNTSMNETKYATHPLVETAWSKIRDHLDDLKENDEMSAYVIKYTNILKLHIENKIPLDHVCIIGLVSCIRPSYIEQIFDLGLIDAVTKLHCLFKPSNLISYLSF